MEQRTACDFKHLFLYYTEIEGLHLFYLQEQEIRTHATLYLQLPRV